MGAPAQAGLAIDARALDNLKRDARANSDKALHAAAKQFEAVFMQMILKSMRDAIPQSDMIENDQTKLFTSMFDQEISQRLASKGLGLADMMMKQLTVKPATARDFTSDPLRMPGEKPSEPTAISLSSAAPAITISLSARQALAKISNALSELGSSQNIAGPTDNNKAPQSFVDRMLSHASVAARATGIPAQFILGQAALESGWGRREIRGADGAASYNLFGIKAGKSWTGPTTEAPTIEYVNGVPRKSVERFRAYGSYAEGFADYARLLASNPRYAQVLRAGQDAAGFASTLQQAGYATDPAYAEKLTRAINHTLSLARSG